MNKKYTFGGIEIAPGPLFFDGKKFDIKKSWDFSSYPKASGKEAGSTFFNFFQLSICDNVEPKTTAETKKGLVTVGDWRLPTKEEWETILTRDRSVREGATVNGITNAHWAAIVLSDAEGLGCKELFGLLVFPDNESVKGRTFKAVDNIDEQTTGFTVKQLSRYIAQGCAFLPAYGSFHKPIGSGFWGYCGRAGFYWTSTENERQDAAFSLIFGDNDDCLVEELDQFEDFINARLVR